jgi:hypothetical protein
MKKYLRSKIFFAKLCVVSLTLFILFTAMIPEGPCEGCPEEEFEPGSYLKVEYYSSVTTTPSTTSVGCPEGQVKHCIRLEATKHINCIYGGGQACVQTPPEGTPIDQTTCGNCGEGEE